MENVEPEKFLKTIIYDGFFSAGQDAHANICDLARVIAWNWTVKALEPHFNKIDKGIIKPSIKDRTDLFDFNKLISEMKAWRKQHTIMFQAPYTVMRFALADVEAVYFNHLRGHCERPKLKDPNDPDRKKTFQLTKVPNGKPVIKKVSATHGKIRLSNKFKWVTIGLNPEWDNPNIRKLTVRQDRGKWQIIIVWEVPDPRKPKNDESVGAIDRNANHALVFHNGEMHDLPERITYLDNKINGIKSRLSKKQKGGKRYKKMDRRKRRWYYGKNNATNGWLNAEVHDTASRFDLVYVEDLDLKRMAEEDWGGKEAKGKKKSKSKRKTTNKMDNANLGKFVRKLSQKTKVVKVPAPYTSCDCPNPRCGHRDKKNRNGEDFTCRACGRKYHADVNAAQNILKRGRLLSEAADGRTSGSIPAPVKVRIHPASNGWATELRLVEDWGPNGRLLEKFSKSKPSDERPGNESGNRPAGSPAVSKPPDS